MCLFTQAPNFRKYKLGDTLEFRNDEGNGKWYECEVTGLPDADATGPAAKVTVTVEDGAKLDDQVVQLPADTERLCKLHTHIDRHLRPAAIARRKA